GAGRGRRGGSFMKRWLGVASVLALMGGLMVDGATIAGALGGGGGQVVHPGESIQAAIDAASPGNTVIVRPGIYAEHLTITKTINLVGFGATLVSPPGDAPPSVCSAPG